MKIGLLGPYSDVSRLIDAPASKPPERNDLEQFENILRDVAPTRAEETRASLRHPPRPVVEQVTPLQQSQPSPAPKLPELQAILPRVEIPDPEIQTVKEPVPSVKTPSVFEVRRIPTAAEFSKLPRAERMEHVEEIAKGVGERFGVDPLLSMAVVSAESSFNTTAVSRDGHASKGLMQLLDSTGLQLHQVSGTAEPYTPFEPAQNMELGVQYLRKLHDYFSSDTALTNGLSTVAAANSTSLEKLAVAAFNAGEGRVASAQERARRAGADPSDYEQVSPYLPESTREYVERVMLKKGQYADRFIG